MQKQPAFICLSVICCLLSACSQPDPAPATSDKPKQDASDSSPDSTDLSEPENGTYGIPLRYVFEDAVAAVALHPKQIEESPVGAALQESEDLQRVFQESGISPADIRRVTFVIGIPTELAENDTTIVQFTRPISRAIQLKNEFGDEPWEEVRYKGVTYYRMVDLYDPESSGVPEKAAVRDEPDVSAEGDVIASFRDDFRPAQNGHTDSTGSGNWFYYSSKTANPTDEKAELYQLKYNKSGKYYQSYRGPKGNTNPKIATYLCPSGFAPRHAVVRWKSKIEGTIRITGGFQKIPKTVSDGDGAGATVLVDGVTEYEGHVDRAHGPGITYDVTARVHVGSSVDFVINPVGNYRGDCTILTAKIRKLDGPPSTAMDAPKIVGAPPVDEDVIPDSDLPPLPAVFFPDDLTSVSTDEVRLRKLLSADGVPQSELVKRLQKLPLQSDVEGIVVTEGLPNEIPAIGELVGPDAADARSILTAATFTGSLSDNTLLTVDFESPDQEAVKKLHEHASQLQAFAQLAGANTGAQFPQPLAEVISELVEGISVKTNNQIVTLSIAQPKKLPAAIAAISEDGLQDFIVSLSPGGRMVQDPSEFDKSVDMTPNPDDPSGEKTVANSDSGTKNAEKQPDPANPDRAGNDPKVPLKRIAPLPANWDVGKGKADPEGNELVLDNDGGPYWIISKEGLPANFRLTIKGRIQFLQGGQTIQNTQTNILRSICVRFCTADQKTDILESRGYHLRHSDRLLLLSREGEVVASTGVDNGPVRVFGIPTGDGLRITATNRAPTPFTTEITKNEDQITVRFNDREVAKYSDRFALSTNDRLAIGGYLSRMYLSDVTIEDLGGEAAPPVEIADGPQNLADPDRDRAQWQPLRFRQKVDSIVLTEDARHLIAVHSRTNTLSVVDVDQLQLIKTISTPSPSAILTRGDELIVANYGRGTLTVFSRKKDWETVRTVQAGDPNPEYLSAPGGRYFRGIVAVRCKGNGRDSCPITIVNIRRGQGVQFSNSRTQGLPR